MNKEDAPVTGEIWNETVGRLRGLAAQDRDDRLAFDACMALLSVIGFSRGGSDKEPDGPRGDNYV